MKSATITDRFSEWAVRLFGRGFEPGLTDSSTGQGWWRFHPFIDLVLLAAIAGMAFTRQTVISFHVAFFGVLLAALRLPMRQFFSRALVTGPIVSTELWFAVRSGRAVAEELWEIPLMGIMLVVAYALKAQQARTYRQLDHERFRIIAGVAHDVRNPLTVVVGFADLLSRPYATFTTDDQADMASRILRAANEAADLIGDLLTASQIETGGLVIQTEPVEVTGIVDHLAEQHGTPERMIGVENLTGQDRLLCLGSELRVRQILRNLITNAIRYGGPRVAIRMARAETEILLQVVDDGEGITESDRERIFEPFAQAERPDRPMNSAGLGLFTSRRLARLMGGDLTYRYQDRTSVFELRLPSSSEPAVTTR